MIAAVIISGVLGIVTGALGMLWLLEGMARESGINVEVNRKGIHLWKVPTVEEGVDARVNAELDRLNAVTQELPVYGRHAAREED